MTVYLDDGDVVLHQGDALEVLSTLPAESVDSVVTSPPYFGLRDYGVDGQIGLEESPEAFVAALVEVFAAVRRVLASHGTCWLNLGDSYANDAKWGGATGGKHVMAGQTGGEGYRRRRATGAKPKDLLGIPWRVALALQADGWWLRSDIIWAKPNPMPESVTDRPTRSHEYVFLLTKAPRYFYDAEAVREASVGQNAHDLTGPGYAASGQSAQTGSRTKRRTVRPGIDTNGGGHGSGAMSYPASGRNLRDIWEIPAKPFPEAHFATFPPELVRRCIAAGCPERVCAECGEPSRRVLEVEYTKSPVHGAGSVVGRHEATGANGWDGAGLPRLDKRVTIIGWTDCDHGAWRPGRVLDPFMGVGTTALVAREQGRHAVGIDLSVDYCSMAGQRLGAERAKVWRTEGPRVLVSKGQLVFGEAA